MGLIFWTPVMDLVWEHGLPTVETIPRSVSAAPWLRLLGSSLSTSARSFESMWIVSFLPGLFAKHGETALSP
jgi:hypothetical protein